MAAPALSDQAKGTLIVAAGVLWLTPDSVFLKKISDDVGDFTTLLYRYSIFYALVVSVFLVGRSMHARGGEDSDAAAAADTKARGATCSRGRSCEAATAALWRNLRETGWVGLGVMFTSFISGACFCIAQRHTSAANVLVVVSSMPLWAALMSRIFLGERIPRRTLGAIVFGVGAIVYVFVRSPDEEDELATSEQMSGSLSVATAAAAEEGRSNIVGLGLAMLCAIFMAAEMVFLRHGSLTNLRAAADDMYFVVCLPAGAVMAAPLYLALGEHFAPPSPDPHRCGMELIITPCTWSRLRSKLQRDPPPLLLGADPTEISAADLGWIGIGGGAIIPISFVALTIGPRYISAPEVSLARNGAAGILATRRAPESLHVTAPALERMTASSSRVCSTGLFALASRDRAWAALVPLPPPPLLQLCSAWVACCDLCSPPPRSLLLGTPSPQGVARPRRGAERPHHLWRRGAGASAGGPRRPERARHDRRCRGAGAGEGGRRGAAGAAGPHRRAIRLDCVGHA